MTVAPAFFPGSLGGGEILILFVVVLLLFGPHELPKIGRKIGRLMEDLRRSSREFQDQVMRLDEDTPAPTPPGPAAETNPEPDAAAPPAQPSDPEKEDSLAG